MVKSRKPAGSLGNVFRNYRRKNAQACGPLAECAKRSYVAKTAMNLHSWQVLRGLATICIAKTPQNRAFAENHDTAITGQDSGANVAGLVGGTGCAIHRYMTHTIETLATRYTDRTARLLPDVRRESLTMALALGASDAALETICDALRVARRASIVLPPQRYENLSRGRGWARKGRGDSAVWGERVDGGYRVGPGHWTVGGNDGFSRKSETVWDVAHVTVGPETWTVAS